MPWDFVAFMLLSTICVITAGGMVASNNPVHAGVFLGLCFIHVAGIFVMLGAEFLAVIQVLVYAGGIVVLYLFVVMLVNLKRPPDAPLDTRRLSRLGFGMAAILLAEVCAILVYTAGKPPPPVVPGAMLEAGNTETVGMLLYTEFLIPFELVSMLLLVAMIGAIILARKEY